MAVPIKLANATRPVEAVPEPSPTARSTPLLPYASIRP
jgi:hypothetical protein